MKRMLSLLMLFYLLTPSASASADTLVPTAKTAFRFEPDGNLPEMGGSFYLACTLQGYTLTTRIHKTVPGTTTAAIGLTDFTSNIGKGYGLVFVGTHGNTAGFQAEVYEKSDAGRAERDRMFEFYLGQGVADTTDIIKTHSADAYGITITAAKIGALFSSAQSIVHVAACFSQSYEATAWPGAALRLGYSGSATTYSADATAFWNHMETGEPASSANLGQLEHAGTLDIALREQVVQAARVHGFSVVGGVARWKVASEYNTGGYTIESSSSRTGPWIISAQDLPAGAGARSCAVPRANFFRLAEKEVDGKRIVHSNARSVSSVAATDPAPMPQLKDLHAELSALGTQRSASVNSTGEKMVVYTTDTLASEVQHSICNYWNYGQGYQTQIITTDSFPSDPDAFRAALKSSIATEAAQGTRYFLLVGDANDWREFDGDLAASLWPVANGWEGIRQGYFASGYPHGGQPQNDLIPTFYIPDNATLPDESVGFYTPYIPSDALYTDIDGDGIPWDVVLTRLPFSSVEEVAAFGLNMQYAVSGAYGPTSVSFLKGDVDHDGPGHGAIAKAAADAVETIVLQHGYPTATLLESDFPIPSERNVQAAALWNQQRSEIIAILSGYSNRSWPGNFFDQTIPVNTWNMSMLSGYANHFPLVIAGSCGGADFSRTEDPDYGSPVFQHFLTTPYVGAISWIGPTAGSDYRANREIVSYLMQELLQETARPIAESFQVAMRRIYQDFAGDQQVLATAQSYVVLGDPLSRVNTLAVATGTAPALHLRTALAQNVPNPFNPATSIYFSTAASGRVRLGVFDLRGREVRTLVNGQLSAGPHVIQWNGTDYAGRSVASGQYLYRLDANGVSESRKMLLLK